MDVHAGFLERVPEADVDNRDYRYTISDIENEVEAQMEHLATAGRLGDKERCRFVPLTEKGKAAWPESGGLIDSEKFMMMAKDNPRKPVSPSPPKLILTNPTLKSECIP